MAEYYKRQSYFDALFFWPYLALGIAITATSCAAPALLRRYSPNASGSFGAALWSTLAGMVLVSAFWDASGLLGFRDGYLLLTPQNFFTEAIVYEIYLIPCLLSGVAEVLRHRYAPRSGKLAAP